MVRMGIGMNYRPSHLKKSIKKISPSARSVIFKGSSRIDHKLGHLKNPVKIVFHSARSVIPKGIFSLLPLLEAK